MRSLIVEGIDPGASSHRTSPLAWYVPVPIDAPLPSKVSHIPPPVTARDVPSPPAGATKVPEPVSVIVELSFARADANPPASKTDGEKLVKWTISHRMCAAWQKATGVRAVGRGTLVALEQAAWAGRRRD